MTVYRQQPDTYDLLSTKLAPPRPRSDLVPREPLLERLDEGLEGKLTLISAPAGFGKTTLMSAWITRRRGEDAGPPVAWVTLDAGDNDPLRFWRYVIQACRAFDVEAGNSALELLRHTQQPPLEVVLTALINDLARLAHKGVLVLEDYEAITSQQVHKTVAFLLEHLPPAVHLAMLTRRDPPFPLARLRAHNHLHEVRAEDLRFSLPETETFLQQVVPFSLSPEVIGRLAERTEGWVAALHLVALALRRRQGQEGAEAYLATFTGSNQPILEYLVADVFEAQPEPLQAFLLQTSILSRLSGSLCDAVTGRDDSATLLDQLKQANLFLIPLEGEGRWYRYHALFAEAMQHYAGLQLGEAELRELAHKASQWYEAHGLPAEAVEAALSARTYPRAAELVEGIIAPRHVQNEHYTVRRWVALAPRQLQNEQYTLRRWMEQLPEEVLRAHPEICFAFAIAILFTSDRHAPETEAALRLPLQIAEEQRRGEGDKRRLGEVLAFRSLVAWMQRNPRESFALAREAPVLLPDEERYWRGISLNTVGVEELLDGRLNAARETLAEARKLNEAVQNMYGTLDSMLLLGDTYTRQGALHQAAQLYRQVLARAEEGRMKTERASIRKGRAHLGLGTLALEWNDLEAAAEEVSQAMEIHEQLPDEDYLDHSPLLLARLQQARGETSRAEQSLQELIAGTQKPLLLREARAQQARQALASSDRSSGSGREALEAAQRWVARRARPNDDDLARIYQEQEALIGARIYLAQDEAEAALRLLQKWLAEAQEQGRTASEIENLVLMALAQATLEELPQARQTLIRALALAQPEGHRRIFLDEGHELAALLRTTLGDISEEPLASYARAILYTMSQEGAKGATANPAEAQLIVEPLTERETDVLRLLSAGLSNRQIADELIISVNTVKTHVKNVYQKLGVSSRQQARDVAYHLKLF